MSKSLGLIPSTEGETEREVGEGKRRRRRERGREKDRIHCSHHKTTTKKKHANSS
jgi:hypothetical protein